MIKRFEPDGKNTFSRSDDGYRILIRKNLNEKNPIKQINWRFLFELWWWIKIELGQIGQRA
jgi:hypothetical protein